jgi:hypothetical protein
VIKQTTCVVVECDDCRNGVWTDGEYDGVPHWESVEAAKLELEPGPGDTENADEFWVFGDDGQTVCPACRAARLCREEGHEFLPAAPCRCGGQIQGHHEDGCPWWRSCGRCAHFEEVPAVC